MCKCHGRCGKYRTAWVLLLIGGLNWGLVGLGMLMHSNWNVINLVLGSWPTVEGIVYLLVGIAAIGILFGCKCKQCKESESNCMGCRVGSTDKPISSASSM